MVEETDKFTKDEAAMTQEEKVFTPSHPLEPGARYGVLSGFDPGIRTLPVGFRLAPAFKALPVDIVLDKDVSVNMRDGVTTYVDILRPAGAEKVPVIVAWSPYGKGQGRSPAAMAACGRLEGGGLCGVEPIREGSGTSAGRNGGVRAGRSGQRDRVRSA